VLSLCLALTLGGCSLTQKQTVTPTATGALKAVSTLVSDFSSDASSDNDSAICKSVLSTSLEQRLNKIGGCTKIITNQLDTVAVTSLTPTKYGVHGNTAEVIVKSTYDGKAIPYTLDLVKQSKGGWRVSSLG
jgi:hypothetical protein